MNEIDTLSEQRPSLERGQSLVLIALVIFALIALLALVLDGGMAYAQRRAAQNAADAGALAGANIYCSTGDENEALVKAVEYAGYNNALEEHGTTASFDNGAIRVDAQIEYDTFFANIFGYDSMNVGATASAGCFLPCSGEIIPIVLACGPPDEDGGYVEGQTDDCFVFEEDTPDARYVIADSTFIECDYGDDVCEEFSQTFSPGLFAWLDLEEGGSGTSNIRNIISGATSLNINLPTWFRDTTGNRTPIYGDLKNHINEIFVVPVFDLRCRPGDPRAQAECASKYNGEPVVPQSIYTGTGKEYFRVHTFALFKVKCVCTGSNCTDLGNGCSGRTALINQMSTLPGYNNGIPNSMNTVEGSFIRGTSEDVSGRCGESTGAGLYTIYLDN
jgi:hypothetical protein